MQSREDLSAAVPIPGAAAPASFADVCLGNAGRAGRVATGARNQQNFPMET